MTEQINHPAHYTSHPSGIEAIDICQNLGFSPGCAFKYLFRRNVKHEDPRVDLQKAIWYLRHEAARWGGGLVSVTDHPLPDFSSPEAFLVFFDEVLVRSDVAVLLRRILPHEPPEIGAAMAYLVRGAETDSNVDLSVAAHFVERAIENGRY